MKPIRPIQTISTPLTNPDLRDDATCAAAAAVPQAQGDAYRPSAWARINKALSQRRSQSPIPAYTKHSQRAQGHEEPSTVGPLHKLARACDRLFGRIS